MTLYIPLLKIKVYFRVGMACHYIWFIFSFFTLSQVFTQKFNFIYVTDPQSILPIEYNNLLILENKLQH